MAERLRMEKRSKTEFDAVKFMELAEEWFSRHEMHQWLTVKASDTYKQYPDLNCKRKNNDHVVIGTLMKNFYWDDFWTISELGVPEEYLKDALKMLQDEGFHLYFVNQFEYKVLIEKMPCIKYGYNTWYYTEIV